MVDDRDDNFWMGRMQLRTSLFAKFSKHTNINQNSQNHFNVSILLFLPGEYFMLYGSTTKIMLLTCNDFSVVTCGFSAFHTVGNRIDIRCVVRFVFIENLQLIFYFNSMILIISFVVDPTTHMGFRIIYCFESILKK